MFKAYLTQEIIDEANRRRDAALLSGEHLNQPVYAIDYKSSCNCVIALLVQTVYPNAWVGYSSVGEGFSTVFHDMTDQAANIVARWDRLLPIEPQEVVLWEN